MKSFDFWDDDKFLKVVDIAKMWEFSVEETLNLFMEAPIEIQAQMFDMKEHPPTPDAIWEGTGEPGLREHCRVPVETITILKLMSEKEILVEGLATADGVFCTRVDGKTFPLSVRDLWVKKKDVVFVAGKFKIAMEPVEYPLELTIALECYKDLYGNGIPDHPNRKKEANEISNWLRDNYTFMEGKFNIKTRERIALMVNPVPYKKNKDIPQRK